MRRLQLVGTGSASASAVANVTIPSAGKLRGCCAYMTVDSTTNDTRIIVEISKIPTTQVVINGSQEPIIAMSMYQNVGAAGHSSNGVNQWYPLDVDVRQGEIIYMHATVVGTGTYYANFILYYA